MVYYSILDLLAYVENDYKSEHRTDSSNLYESLVIPQAIMTQPDLLIFLKGNHDFKTQKAIDMLQISTQFFLSLLVCDSVYFHVMQFEGKVVLKPVTP